MAKIPKKALRSSKIGRPAKPVEERKRHTLGVRMNDELRQKLAAAAAKNRWSVSEEVVARIIATFAEETALGGADLRQFALLMAARFRSGGEQAAESRIGVNATAKQWLSDGYCYDAAVLGVVEALWARRPKQSKESTVLWFERLKGRVLSKWLDEAGESQ